MKVFTKVPASTQQYEVRQTINGRTISYQVCR